MKNFIVVLAVLLSGLGAGAQTATNSFQNYPSVPNPVPVNSTKPHYYNTQFDPCQNGLWTVAPSTTQLGAQFTLASVENETTGMIYNAAGTQVRIAWLNRAYQPGTYCYLWDGNDDFGNAVTTGGPYTFNVVANNIVVAYAGIGNTSDNWGANSWHTQATSFPSAMACMKRSCYTANSYAEGAQKGSVFNESTPNSPMSLNLNNFGGPNEWRDVATDGDLLYYLQYPNGNQGATGYAFVVPVSPSGTILSFQNGTAFSTLTANNAFRSNTGTTLNASGITVLDATPTATTSPAAPTGLAVQRDSAGSGNLLVTCHGAMNVAPTIPSADSCTVWNKLTGLQLTTFSVPNPQRLAFDLAGNLWIIGGNGTSDVLYFVPFTGATPGSRSQPITGLQNPMALAVSPTTGHLFIADGGSSQQIKEYNVSTSALVTTLGVAGGYCASTCNANIDPAGHNTPTWYFDPPCVALIHHVGGTTECPFWSFITVDDTGDLWVGDFTVTRIMHYTNPGSGWAYVNRIMGSFWVSSRFAIPTKTPSRVFGGPNGMLEYNVDYTKTILSGDPEAAGGNASWDVVRNWMPGCVAAGNCLTTYGGELTFAEQGTNGVTVGTVYDTHNAITLMAMPVSGLTTIRTTNPPYNLADLDQDLNQWVWSVTATGTVKTSTLTETPVTSFDANGFPNWSSTGITIASATNDHALGYPYMTYNYVHGVTSGTIVPGGVVAFQDSYLNADVTNGVAFHVGFIKAGATSLFAWNSPQQNKAYPDGTNYFPQANVAINAQLGTGISGIVGTPYLVSFFNGNSSAWGCQYGLYREDGAFLAEIGYNTGAYWPQNLGSWGIPGYPPLGQGLPVAQGLCTDATFQKPLSIGGDIYLWNADEGYEKVIHQWHLSNLGSIITLSGSGTFGSTVSLH